MDCLVNLRILPNNAQRLCWLCLIAFGSIGVFAEGANAQRQIRTKKPDRGVYQAPSVKVEASAPLRRGQQLVDAEIESASSLRRSAAPADRRAMRSAVRPVAFTESVFDDSQLQAPLIDNSAHDVMVDSAGSHAGHHNHQNVVQYDSMPPGTIIGEAVCGVEAIGCDSNGCDSIGGCGSGTCGNGGCGRCLPKANGFISFSPDRWFGSVELLLMYRRGDRPPTLLTTGPSTNDDTAGEIGQAGTSVVVGGEPIFKDVTAGGRLTLGTWLDNNQNRSLIFRGWFAGEKTFGFVRDQDSLSVIARPFEDVSDNQAAAQDTFLVAFPNRATGSISIRGDSNVYGADVSVRQFWYGTEGLSIDFLYGYQFMRLDENLSIRSSSISLDDDFAPVGSTIAISDSFDIENEFHGGQIGIASMYREGCWSLSTLAKLGFGSLARRADLQGETSTSIDGNTAVDNQGLLVRDLNSGKRTDHTFGFVPELDLTLGWRKFPNYEVTIGYHVTALTDALQVSGAIDPSLAVNLSDPPTGQQSPSAAFNDRTFYVQGIHFGLQYVY